VKTFLRLLRGDGDQGQLFVDAGFREGEEKHDGRERALRLPVAVVNPDQ